MLRMKMAVMFRAISIGLLVILSQSVKANNWYCAPMTGFRTTSVDTGVGTQASPWELKDCLENKTNGAPNNPGPGDTIWLAAGVYHRWYQWGGSQAFNFSDGPIGSVIPLTTHYNPALQGSAGNPIIIRAMPGAHVQIDGAFDFTYTSGVAKYLRFQDLDVGMITFTNRSIGVGGDYSSWGDCTLDTNVLGYTTQQGNMDISGFNNINGCAGIEVINCLIHDFGNCGAGGGSLNFYGNALFFNGFLDGGTDTRGHGLYLQGNLSDPNPGYYSNNVSFANCMEGAQLNGTSATFNNVHIDGLVSFNNNTICPAKTFTTFEIDFAYASDGSTINNCSMNNCLTWTDHSTGGDGNIIDGSGETVTGTFSMTNNLFNIRSNPGEITAVFNGLPPSVNFNFNTLINTPMTPSGASAEFPNNILTPSEPTTGSTIFVRPNAYEAGRAWVIIYNWALANSVSVNLSGLGYTNGQTIEVRQVQDYWNDCHTAVYSSGTVSFSMVAGQHTQATPAGANFQAPTTTFPSFGVFQVRNTNYTIAIVTNPPSSTGVSGAVTAAVSGSNVTVSATATPSAGSTISQVSFYGDGAWLGAVTGLPYSETWSNAAPGQHYAYANIHDSALNSAQTPWVYFAISTNGTITTTNAPVAPPQQITSANGVPLADYPQNISAPSGVDDFLEVCWVSGTTNWHLERMNWSTIKSAVSQMIPAPSPMLISSNILLYSSLPSHPSFAQVGVVNQIFTWTSNGTPPLIVWGYFNAQSNYVTKVAQ